MVTARARAVAVLGGACLASALLPSLIVAPGAAVELDDTSSTIVTTDQVGSSDVVDAPADDQGSSGNGDEPRPAPEPTPAPPAPTAPNAVEPSEPTAAPDDALTQVLRVVDKIDKIGADAVASELVSAVGVRPGQAEAALRLATIRSDDPGDVHRAVIEALDGAEPTGMLQEGVAELGELLSAAATARPGALTADLKIARGLDYYTGTVYESFMAGAEDLGSVCSGGRYDNLATSGKRTFPGVGISIGLSRLLSRVLADGLVSVTRPVPTVVLVAVTDEEHRSDSDAIADALRARGVAADVAPTAAKFGKQIKFADKRGIPFVWFPAAQGGADSVKDIRSGEQVEADADHWLPADPADLAPRVRALRDGRG